MGDGRFLVSWADGDVNERNELANVAPDFGLYLFDPESGTRTLVYDRPGFWDLYAIPVRPREEPPVIPSTVDGAYDSSEPAIIGSIDVTQTSLTETVSGGQFDGTPLGDALRDAVAVPHHRGLLERDRPGRPVRPDHARGRGHPRRDPGLRRRKLARGGASVPAVPPPAHRPLRHVDPQPAAVDPGDARRDPQLRRLPRVALADGAARMGPTTLAQQVGPDMSTHIDIPDRIELPWYGAASRENVQDVLDRNCVGCHDGGASDPFAGRTYTVNVTTMEGEMLTYQIPYLDLSDRLLEVYYENEVVSYPASYVSLLYPSAMMGDSMAVGDVPPEWVIPGEARASRLIEVVNMSASGDATDLAWADRPMHPEDQGVTVSREDRLVLIRMSDLGGQYYSRWNVDGGYDWSMATEYP
ncbi:MAG: hypothetical protein M5U28_36355 [Sandaracinaceae bacterium]|nr:hypothetical protein [Sandaracinaceae bacterium]